MRQPTYLQRHGRVIVAVLFVVFGVVGRLLLLDVPNLEPLTAMSLLAGSMLAVWFALGIPLATIVVSDVIIGNSAILLFTWSAWVGIGAMGLLLRKRTNKPARFALEMTGMGVVATFVFYLWTNFGVWAIESWYPHTFGGLVQSYIMGLPFLRPQLFGNLVLVPVVAFVAASAKAWVTAKVTSAMGDEGVK